MAYFLFLLRMAYTRRSYDYEPDIGWRGDHHGNIVSSSQHRLKTIKWYLILGLVEESHLLHFINKSNPCYA